MPVPYFPICSDPQGKQKFATAIGKGEIKRIPLGSEKLLLAVQPYVSGDETLWHIHELDRIDKHRLLITAVAGFNEWRVDAGYGQGPRFPQSATVPLEVGYEIVNIPTSTYHRESHDNFKLKTDIAFGQSEIVGGKSILETLNKMAIVVDDIITRFEPYLL